MSRLPIVAVRSGATKRLVPAAMVVFCASPFAFMASAYAQDEPEIMNFHIFPTQIVGQTCLENQDNKEIKCADLTTSLTPVATLDVKTPSSSDVQIQYCAKVEDPMGTGLKCLANVDSVPAVPGSLDPLEQLSSGVSIYEFCLTWFGKTAGTRKHSVSEIDVECEAKVANSNVRIDSSTTSVFAR